MPTESEIYSSGSLADHVGLPRWRLLYLIERGRLPGPSLKLAGRRVFTAEDAERISRELAANPDLREWTKPAGSSQD